MSKRPRLVSHETHDHGCCRWTTLDGALQSLGDNPAFNGQAVCAHEPYLQYSEGHPVLIGLNSDIRVVIYSGYIGLITGGNVQLRREVALDAHNLQIWCQDGIIHRNNGPAIVSCEVSIWCIRGCITRVQWAPKK
jgi:hypothetical protein